MWGQSPSLDLQQLIEECAPSSITELHTVNVLVAGARDVRHVLRTLSQMYRHPAARRVQLYVLESSVESIARQLFLLTLALEPPEVMSHAHKTKIFLEVYGNTLIRPNTLQYVRHKANQLIYMVTDPSYLRGRIPLLNLDQLKYKERDYLECTYKFWKTATTNEFDILNLWDERLRNSLGVRYDSRPGLFDWDYHMKLNSSIDQGTPVTAQEYVGWRETGVAFRWPDLDECTDINVTFATGSFAQQTYRMCEYSGDQLTGPYISFGIECEDIGMLKKFNNKFIKTSSEICERNVNRIMYELAYRKPYDAESMTDTDGGGLVVMNEPLAPPPLRRSDTETSTNSSILNQREEYSCLSIDDISITFLPPGTLEDERPSARFRGTFHTMWIGHDLLPQILAPPLLGLATDNALLLLEGRKFEVGPKRCQLQEFNEILLETATDLKLETIPPDAEFDPAHQELMKYIINKR